MRCAVGCLADKFEIQVPTALAHSQHTYRVLLIILFASTVFSEPVVLCSTDTEQPVKQIAEYYRLRC